MITGPKMLITASFFFFFFLLLLLFEDAIELDGRDVPCASGWKFGLKLAAEPAEN